MSSEATPNMHEGELKPSVGMIEFIALMAFLTSLVALAIDAMLPALSTIGSDLGASSQQEVHLIVSLFFGGMSIGQLFFGPLADALGRRTAIILGLIIFAIGSVICMYAPNMEVMLAGRLVQAIGVSGPRIASIAVIRDLFVGERMARVMSFIMMVFILVPMLAPIVGQAVLNFYSWHAIFVLFLVVAAFAGIWFLARQPETLPKAKRIPFSFSQFGSSFKYIVTHVSVMGYALAMGLIFGAFLAYLSATQTIFVGFYDQGEFFPYIFASLAFSIGIASFFNGRLVMQVGMVKLCRIASTGSVGFAGAFLFAVVAFQGLPPLWLTVSLLFCGFFFVGILFGNLNAMAMIPLGKTAGLGAAIIGSMTSLFAVPIAALIDHFVTDNLYPIALGFLVFFSIAKYCMYVADKHAESADSSESA